MAQVEEHLRTVAVNDYGASADDVANLSSDQLADVVLRGIATTKYSVDASELEGKDTRGLVEVLLGKMVVDLLKVDPEKVTPTAAFSDLGADSLDMVELLMSIEDTFEPFGGLKIADEDADIATVDQAVDRITAYINVYLKGEAPVA